MSKSHQHEAQNVHSASVHSHSHHTSHHSHFLPLSSCISLIPFPGPWPGVLRFMGSQSWIVSFTHYILIILAVQLTLKHIRDIPVSGFVPSLSMACNTSPWSLRISSYPLKSLEKCCLFSKAYYDHLI